MCATEMRQMRVSASVVVTILASSWLAGCAARSAAQIPAIPAARPASASTAAPTPSQGSAETTASQPAPSGSAGAKEGTAAGAKTPDEQRDTLDGDLQTSLAKFDAMLLKEQQEVAAKRAEHGGGAAGASGGAGGEGEGSGSSGGGAASGGGSTQSTENTHAENGRGGQGRSGSKDKGTGSSKTDRSGGGRDVATAPEGTPTLEQGDASRVPADVGDGRNDDVVARQIREAAMAEDDPRIRERLWEEYRRYKRGES
jgi:hypothetical protein